MREPSSPPFISRAHRATKRYLYAWGTGKPTATGRCAIFSAAKAPDSPR